MRFSFVIIALLSLLAVSCARDEQRARSYDPKVCPFCSTNPGTCFYCEGTAKCSFCRGTGTRLTATPDNPDLKLKRSQYSEKCPFCKGTGTCRYCDGKGTCWVCKGSGKVESWDFYDEHLREKAASAPQAPAVADSAK